MIKKLSENKTISFFGTVTGGQNKTLVSQLISQKFKTKRIRAAFAPGTERTMTLKFFISGDKEEPTTKEPEGTNLLQQTGQVAYITGDDNIVTFEHEILQDIRNSYLKVYAENTDAFDHTIEAQITIELINENDNTQIENTSASNGGV